MKLSELDEALAEMAKAMGRASESLGHLTCSEIDAVLWVLVLTGHVGEATTALLGHASFDDGAYYPHYDIAEAVRRGATVSAREMAEQYARALA